MENEKLAQQILTCVGGSLNIVRHWHCITRLRFNLNDNALVDVEKLKNIDGVMGVNFQGEQLQIILGNKVNKVFAELDKLIVSNNKNTSIMQKHKNKISINTFFDFLSGVFTPILPAIVGTGLLKGILSLLLVLGWLSETNVQYKVLFNISEAAFYFLPILIASSAAKKFGTNEYLAMALAGILLFPSLSASMLTDKFTIDGLDGFVFAGRESLSFLGMSIPNNIDYHSSVIPILLSVWLLSYINRWVEKVIPAILKMIISPIIVLVVTSIIMLIFIAPLGAYIGTYLSEGFKWLFSFAGIFAGFLMGGSLALFVITGMHYAIFPSCFENFRRLNYDFMLLPMSFVSNLAQAGATFAVAIKVKNKAFKSLAYSAALSAMLGITEPAIYGVTMKLRRPFYISLFGSAIGGALVGALSIKTYQFSLPGLSSLPTYIDVKGDLSNFYYVILAISLSFFIAFILTLMTKLDESLVVGSESSPKGNHLTESTDKIEEHIKSVKDHKIDSPIEIITPITGELIPLSQVPDTTFAQKIMGDGIAIIPAEETMFAPFDGHVSVIAMTKHAIGLISNDGAEILIHVGLETVSLGGKGFDVLVDSGQKVTTGQPLLKFDLDFMKQNKVSLITPIVVTNYQEFESFSIVATNKYVEASKDIVIQLN
ncbi:beta-glucoside-specific PTS transporter subunit IIABC [Orbus sturtevantii]|uniref:beta-glucoside-specific PTS transporter subunit IIABC n=1 Tax=Orbus sturtevantii TaxID=3074109 RepID=UPI00370D9F56